MDINAKSLEETSTVKERITREHQTKASNDALKSIQTKPNNETTGQENTILPTVGFKIHIQLSNLKLYSIKDLTQVYLSVEMLNLDSELLETQSFKPSHHINLDYDQEFDFKELNRESLRRTWFSELIRVNLVQEPSPGDIDLDCIDLGHAETKLCDISDSPFELEIKGLEKDSIIGTVTVQITGLRELQSYLSIS